MSSSYQKRWLFNILFVNNRFDDIENHYLLPLVRNGLFNKTAKWTADPMLTKKCCFSQIAVLFLIALKVEVGAVNCLLALYAP